MGETHIVKTWPPYFQAVKRGEKRFEIRRDDRGYQKGDLLEQREYDPKRGVTERPRYTGEYVTHRIAYVLTGGQFGLEPGFVALSLEEPSDDR